LFRLRLTSAFDYVDAPEGLSDVSLFRAEFHLEDAALELRPAEDAFAVQRLNLKCGRVLTEDDSGTTLTTSTVESIVVS
jgi:hypothetical protein